MEVSLKNIKKLFLNKLQGIYEEREIVSLFQIVCETILGLSKTDLLLKDIVSISKDNELTLKFILQELKTKKPIQYILKEAHFYSRVFKVNKHVLIPRQETEELIKLIVKTNKVTNPKILDVGTGSGIIPITLNKELAFSKVYALDISVKALDVAKENTIKHNGEVSFLALDILDETKWEEIPNNFDVIVSNPPYVLNSEKKLIHKNVLDNEPHLALFVEDDNPLLFYKKITKLALSKLKIGGKIYFEINEQYGEETANVLSNNFKEVNIIKDINKKDRFVYGVLLKKLNPHKF